ncbi:GNAT family N-acetyltransferase [Paenibacillus sp. P26]|nr:GNAT family N-acetyltransferase [Paenibacillus sp. P26]UUZ92313.1 GNAT family N-acetyltransferase [Paenibacillus sp. P25]
MGYTFRFAQETDYEEIAALNRQIFHIHAKARPDLFNLVETPLEKIQYEELLQTEHTKVIVMEKEFAAGILGYAVLKVKQTPDKPVLKPRRTVYISDFGVDERIRHQGLGSSLMQHVVSLAGQWEADFIELSVFEFNTSAVRFYEKLGFYTKSRRMEIRVNNESD